MAQIPTTGLLQILAKGPALFHPIPLHSTTATGQSADNRLIQDEKGTRAHGNSHICDLSIKLIPTVTQVVFVQLSGVSVLSLSMAFSLNNRVESTSAVMARW